MRTETNNDRLMISNIDMSKAVRSNIKATATSLTLLADDLYKNKPGAICREIISNGNDSHRRAGCGDRPVEVRLPTIESPVLVIRDFGTGLDEDGINRMLDLFSSDKGESDEELGGFGVGANSPRAYTKQYQVTSFLNGQKYHVLCFDDEDGMPTHVINSITPTDEPNGLMVTIPIRPKSIKTFINEVRRQTLFFTPQPKIVNIEEQPKSLWGEHSRSENMFTIPVRECEANGLTDTAYVIIDQVLYPVSLEVSYFIEEIGEDKINERSVMGSDGFDWSFSEKLTILENWRKTNNCVMFFPFSISQIKPSLSRESISMTPRSINALTSRINVVLEDVTNLTKQMMSMNSITEIWENFSGSEIDSALKLLRNIMDNDRKSTVSVFKKCVDETSNTTTRIIDFVGHCTAMRHHIPTLPGFDKKGNETSVDAVWTSYDGYKFSSASRERSRQPFDTHVVIVLNNDNNKTVNKEYIAEKLYPTLPKLERDEWSRRSRYEHIKTNMIIVSYGRVDTEFAMREIEARKEWIPHNVIVVDMDEINKNEFCAVDFSKRKSGGKRHIEPGYWTRYRTLSGLHERKLTLPEMVDVCRDKQVFLTNSEFDVYNSDHQMFGVSEIINIVGSDMVLFNTSPSIMKRLIGRLNDENIKFRMIDHRIKFSEHIDIRASVNKYLRDKKHVDEYMQYLCERRLNDLKENVVCRYNHAHNLVLGIVFGGKVNDWAQSITPNQDEVEFGGRIHKNVKEVVKFVFRRCVNNELDMNTRGTTEFFDKQFSWLYSEKVKIENNATRLKRFHDSIETKYPWLSRRVLNSMINEYNVYSLTQADHKTAVLLRRSMKKVK